MKQILFIICLIAPLAINAQSSNKQDLLIQEVRELRKELHIADSLNKLMRPQAL